MIDHSVSLCFLSKSAQLRGLPRRASSNSAGYDMCVDISNNVIIAPGQTKLMPTGLAMHINHPGIVGMIFPRSGLGHKHGLVLGNSTGIIDADYQGEIMLSLLNRLDQDFQITPGMRVAQLIFVSHIPIKFDMKDSFDIHTDRFQGGFGHSGHD